MNRRGFFKSLATSVFGAAASVYAPSLLASATPVPDVVIRDRFRWFPDGVPKPKPLCWFPDGVPEPSYHPEGDYPW